MLRSRLDDHEETPLIIPLAEATPANSGTKAAVLGRLLRAGFPVPPGFVIPINTHRTATTHPDPPKPHPLPNPNETPRPAEDHAVPAGSIEEQAVPGWSVEERAVPGVSGEDQTVPEGSGEGQAAPAMLVEEQAAPGRSGEDQAVPGRSGEEQAVPTGLVEGEAVPGRLVEERVVPAGLDEEQAVPAGSVEGAAVPEGWDEGQALLAGSVEDHAGFVDEPATLAVPAGLVEELGGVLEGWGDEPVAVRSSAVGEDGSSASAAGQYDSFLGVRGVPVVVDRVRAIWGSLWGRRAVAYRRAFGQEPGQPEETAPGIAVIVQRQVRADVAGVLFTADRRTPDDSTPTAVLEASWGLGESVVQGLVTPDAYTLTISGVLTRQLGTKATRRDAGPAGGVVVSEVSLEERERFCLDEGLVRRVVELGRAVADELGGPQDIEFAVEGERVWLLQARPITAPLTVVDPVEEEPGVLRGVGGSPGVATGPARVVEGVGDFGRVEKGDVLVCRFTDPAWTALFGVVAGVVTEVGGRLSHAAIVAREHRIPAVLGVAGVMSAVEDGQVITVAGNTGMVSVPGLLQP
ncbi:PEP-utilizing enzyme [Kribbella sp. NBC_00382]|uniref:PEP/pyruvate-binding domain-containing protein n=1 Tax=Kribbella sp. NBC_00382 TaxID=2975967 RepID=UPI002E1CD681